MSARAKLVSIALVFGIVGQAFGISTPATASDQSSLQAVTQPRLATISPLPPPLAAPGEATSTIPPNTTLLSDETASVAPDETVSLAAPSSMGW
jgi:hypothetical protein